MNQTTGKHFNDYLNCQRIAYCLDFIRSGQAEHLNMNGISQHCGFNNRNTFAHAFKKVTGKLPSEYITGSNANT
ncbi:helix-turn-helix domain-containing protein [Paraflavitalea speifideaquila]|uniref:helix-turn-helix domain-containing protein n=1 Tax=Paraflavitalea speifideaquila TaxID=3076558 RepID=UPI0028E54861|nr:helix-turn-helix domain-containing protein [Paraflavitalea speifideiaquila]